MVIYMEPCENWLETAFCIGGVCTIWLIVLILIKYLLYGGV